MSEDVNDLLAQAEEAQREYADHAQKADEARRKADTLRIEAARAHELSAAEYARTAAPDETRLRELRNRDLPGATPAVADPEADSDYASRFGDTGVDVNEPDKVEEVFYTDHTGKVSSQPDHYDRADVQLYEQEHAAEIAEVRENDESVKALAHPTDEQSFTVNEHGEAGDDVVSDPVPDDDQKEGDYDVTPQGVDAKVEDVPEGAHELPDAGNVESPTEDPSVPVVETPASEVNAEPDQDEQVEVSDDTAEEAKSRGKKKR